MDDDNGCDKNNGNVTNKIGQPVDVLFDCGTSAALTAAHIPMEEKTTESNGAVLGDELLMGREKMQRAR